MRKTLFALFCGAMLLVCACGEGAAQQERMVVAQVHGTAELLRAAQTTALGAGTALEPGDVIRTGPGSSVDIALEQGTENMLHVGASTQIAVSDIVPGEDIEISLAKGRVLSRLKDLRGASGFRVRTPVVVAGIRGSGLGVSIGDSGRISVACYEDKAYLIVLDAAGNEVETVPLAEGLQIVIDALEQLQEAGPLTDEERAEWTQWLSDIEELIGDGAPEQSDLQDDLDTIQNMLNDMSEQHQDIIDAHDVQEIEQLQGSDGGGDDDEEKGGDEQLRGGY